MSSVSTVSTPFNRTNYTKFFTASVLVLLPDFAPQNEQHVIDRILDKFKNLRLGGPQRNRDWLNNSDKISLCTGTSKTNLIDIGLDYEIESEKVHMLSDIHSIMRKNTTRDEWKVWLVLAVDKTDWFEITPRTLARLADGFKLDVALRTTPRRPSEESVFTRGGSCVDPSYKGPIESFWIEVRTYSTLIF